MAILNGKYRVKNSQNEYDIIHLETSANQVIFADGETFQDKLNNNTLKGNKGDKGDRGADGLTTSVTVNGIKLNHSDGNITLPDYPTKLSQLENDITLEKPSAFTWAKLSGSFTWDMLCGI